MFAAARERWRRGAEGVAAVIFALLFLVFIVQVAARFLFNRPLAWSDELIVILYIAMVFWSAATLLKERDHVMLDLVYEALPPAGQRAFALAGAGLTAALMGVLLPQAFDYVRFMHREKTPVLDVPFSFVFAPFVLFVALIGIQYVVKFARLLGRDWREHL
jgi:TRAP-type C4-dicarboxylate transport system permease small subunit